MKEKGEKMEIAAMALGFLSVVLGLSSIGAGIYISKSTEKLIQTEDERAKNLIAETQKMIEEGKRQTQQLIERMDERWHNTINYIASLIKVEGDKTRELIKQVIKE